MSEVAYARIDVSDEFMRDSGAWRPMVRKELRAKLAELGTVQRVSRVLIDPLERHGITEFGPGPAPGSHLIVMVARLAGRP